MPRRKGHQAELAVHNEQWNRWRILLRHQKFQASVNRLRGRYQKWVNGPPINQRITTYENPYIFDGEEIPHQIEAPIKRTEADLWAHNLVEDEPMVTAWSTFADQWDLRLPKIALSEGLPDLNAATIKTWEAVSEASHGLISPPVRPGAFGGGDWLDLEINLTYPRDVLMERIEEHLSQAIQQHRHGPARRKRWDKMDFYLGVYDLARNGESFRAIASAVGNKRLSTVKSACCRYAELFFVMDQLVRTEREGLLPGLLFPPRTHCPSSISSLNTI